MSIGQQLRQARLSQELSLDQATQATHIRLHYLEAMEADQFERLPSTAQLRGFLRAYGDYLKLDSAALIQALDSSATAVSEVTAIPPVNGKPEPGQTSAEGIFKEIGQKLSSQRELMGLSLGDVERHTHLRMHYVRALEHGDISHLPSPVQGRGMLSNYASFLGMDTEAILLRFADGLQASLYDRQAAQNIGKLKEPAADPGRVPARPSQFKRLFSMDLFVGGFLILFLLGFTIWGALHISTLNSQTEPTTTAPPVSEILLATPSSGASGSSTPQVTLVLTAAPISIGETSPITGTGQLLPTETPIVFEPTAAAGSAAIQLSVVANQRAWMRVTVDGKVAFEGRTLPGSAYSFAGNERIELVTGDGAGLQAYFNQQDLGVLGGFGEVVERIFTVLGVQTPTPSIPLTSTPVPSTTPTLTGTATRTPTPGRPTATPQP